MLYLATWSRVYSWDSIAFTARAIHHPVLSERYLSTTWFHPHHLLYVPIASWVFGLFGFASVTPLGAFVPLLWLSSLSGACAAGAAAYLVFRVTDRIKLGLLAGSSFALINGVWAFSTTAEVMLPAILFLLLGALLLTSRKPLGILAAGLVIGFAVLLHQIIVFFVAGVIVMWLLKAREEGEGTQGIWAFTAVLAAFVTGAYLLIGIAAEGIRSPGQLIQWIFTVAPRARIAEAPLWLHLYHSFRTFVDAVVTLGPFDYFRGGAGLTPSFVLWLILVSILGVLGIFTVGPVLLRLRVREWFGKIHPVFSGLLLGAAGIAVFNTIYSARNFDFWIYPAAALAITVPLLWHEEQESKSGPPFRRLVVLLVVLGSVNLLYRAIPMKNPAIAPYSDILEFAAAHMTEGDRFYIAKDDQTLIDALIVLPFFAGVDTREVGSQGEAPAASTNGATFATVNAYSEWDRSAHAPPPGERIGVLRGEQVLRTHRRPGN